MRTRFIRLIVVFLCVGLLAAGALPALATSNTIQTSLSDSDPVFDNLYTSCTPGVLGQSHYVASTVEITAAGDYALWDVGWFDGDAATLDAIIIFYPVGGFNSAVPVANCIDSGDDTSIITIPAPGRYTMVISSFVPMLTGAVYYVIDGPGFIRYPENGAFSDGRINNWDPAAPLVLYGIDRSDGRGLIAYSPTKAGQVLFEVSAADIAAVPDCPAENALIAQSGAIALYRLTSCGFELHAPSLDGAKTYVVQFSGLYPGAFTHSSEN